MNELGVLSMIYGGIRGERPIQDNTVSSTTSDLNDTDDVLMSSRINHPRYIFEVLIVDSDSDSDSMNCNDVDICTIFLEYSTNIAFQNWLQTFDKNIAQIPVMIVEVPQYKLKYYPLYYSDDDEHDIHNELNSFLIHEHFH